MPDSDPFPTIMTDPKFLKMPEPSKYDVVIGVLENRDPSFVKRDPTFKHQVASQLLQQYKVISPYTMGATGPAELRKPIPGAVQFGENYVLPAIGGAVGAAAGGALGGPVGAAAGAGAGLVGADLLSAKINQKFFGRHPDLTTGSVVASEAPQFALGAAGEVIPIESMAKGVLGITSLEAGARGASEQATGAAERFGEQQTQRMGEGLGQIAQAGQQEAQRLAPQARTEIIQQSLSRTPEEGAQARAQPPTVVQAPARGSIAAGQAPAPAAIPSVRTITRQGRFHDSVFKPLSRTAKALGQRYETLFAPVKGKTVDDFSGLSNSIADLNKFSQENAFTYERPLRELMGEMPAVGTAQDEAAINEAIRGRSTPAVQARLTKLQNEWTRTHPGKAISQEELRSLGAQALGGPATVKPTVEQMMGWRSRAGAIAANSTSAHDQSGAFDLMDSIDDTLSNAGLVDKSKLAAINRQYGSYKRLFGRTTRRKVAMSFEPTNEAGEIFDDPQRFQHLWHGGTADERATLKENYADWLLRNGTEKAAAAIEKPDQRQMLQTMYPGTPLADPKHWIHLDDKLATAENIMNTSPALKQEYQAALTSRIRQISDEADHDAVKWAQKEGPKLGDIGKAMAKDARTARTPREGAQIVVDFMRTHPEAAPIQALQRGLEGGKESGFMGRARAGLSWYPQMYIASALMGHPSTWGAVGLGMGGVYGVHAALKGVLKAALKNPDMARLFWRAINDSNSLTRTRALGRLAADAMRGEVATQTDRLGAAFDLVPGRKAEEDQDNEAPAASNAQ